MFIYSTLAIAFALAAVGVYVSFTKYLLIANLLLFFAAMMNLFMGIVFATSEAYQLFGWIGGYIAIALWAIVILLSLAFVRIVLAIRARMVELEITVLDLADRPRSARMRFEKR